VEVEVAELTTGSLTLKCLAGSGTTIKVSCVEHYDFLIELNSPRAKRCKGDRIDHIHGKLCGPKNFYTKRNGINVFETSWIRAFRYIQLTISTQDGGMTIQSLSYKENRYPREALAARTPPCFPADQEAGTGPV
jgi:hypothetical protein